MALLTVEKRKEYFKELGLGEYNEENIKALQKRYMLRKSDADGKYGTNTDNLLRHLWNCHLYLKPENFKPEEFRCGCNGRHCCGYPTYMKAVELKNVQAIRTHFGKPMTITCGLRDPEYNREVGGIPNSEHKKGLAVDYHIKGVTDTLANRKSNIAWISKLPGHHYTYGDGIFIETANGKTSRGYVSAPGMGNAMHTDSRGSESAYDEDGKLICDGSGGPATVKEMQRFFGTAQDGVISGQNKKLAKYFPALTAVKYGSGGSPCIKNLQRWVGTTTDGILGENTIKAWQEKLKSEGYYKGAVDAIFGTNSMKAWQKYLNEHEKAVYPTPADYYKVIDVSDHQDKIDWQKVNADGIVGAIIRFADGTTLDKRFTENMKAAKAAGLHIGSYIYSRAKTKAEAESEAERLYNACKPYDLDMPLYIDVEAKGLEKYADTVAQAFLNKMAKLGGRGGVYSYLVWWNNYLKETARDYSANPFWIAQYNETMDYKPAEKMGMWQYTSEGRVDGIKGNVDMDKCFVPYWEKKPKVSWVDRANAWAKMIADCNSFHYVKWKSSDEATKTCPICKKRVVLDAVYDAAKKVFKLLGLKINCDKKYVGWNCIGFTYAVWHHGGGIPCKCNDGVISDEIAERMLQMSAAAALAEARKRIGLKDLKVIINKKGIPKEEWKAGDICMYFNGAEYIHNYYYMGNGQIAESTGSSGKIPNNDQIRIKSYKSKSAQMIIRYIGE